MIHLMTATHFGTPKWIDLQLSNIRRHLGKTHVWAFCDGFDISPHLEKFHFCENGDRPGNRSRGSPNHWGKLNRLTELVLESGPAPDDILIWMDSDAFPIAPMGDYLKARFRRFPFLAINRFENHRDVIPHPSFACTTVRFCRRHGLNWRGGAGAAEGGLRDTGGHLYLYLRDRGIAWYRLRRTASLTSHPVHFTIYDRVIYHHACGSRGRSCRLDLKSKRPRERFNEKAMFQEVLRRYT